MFTGLVQAVGRVQVRVSRARGCRLVIDPCGWSHVPDPGESISVSGCCLTFAPEAGDSAGLLGFDVVAETLARTSLGSLQPGDRVNLEASLQASSLIGGHFVQGHVEGLATLLTRDETEGAVRMKLKSPAELMPCIVPKGSVALEGVSLTVAAAEAGAATFDVALIPTTLHLTNLSEKKPGDSLNLETDILVRSVLWHLKGKPA